VASRSFDRRQLSRSKLDLFLECPRCFYDDVALGNGRPGGPAFTLNIAVDELFKREFDAYRARQEPHPLFASVGLDAVPLQDPRLDAWRRNFTGVRWLDQDTSWTLFGAVDDLWLCSNGLKTADGFRDTLRFETRRVPYDGNRSWLLEAFRAAVSLVQSGQRPEPGRECAWCNYAATWAGRPGCPRANPPRPDACP
jgi:hypothetical protein